MRRRCENRSILYTVLLTACAAALCGAQTTGYISGTSSLTSFNITTGALVSSFSAGGTGTAFAVASDDATLYMPTNPPGNAGALNVVSGASGQTLNTLPLGQGAAKVILNSAGSTAYVDTPGYGDAGGSTVDHVTVVDTATLAVAGTLAFRAGLSVQDIALSPDDTTLYVAIYCHTNDTSCSKTGGACPVLNGVCAFNAQTLALKGKAENVSGYLAVSQDNKSLYVTQEGAASRGFYIVNTSTFAITSRYLPYEPYGPTIVSPVGNFALILVGANAQGGTTAYALNTSTNKIVGEFFVNPPDSGYVLYGVGPAPTAAFAPDGKSVWMLVECAVTNCPLPAQRNLVGLSFPSGALIGAITPIPADVVTLAFPQ